MTEAESVLWNALRSRRCHGLKFRRQVPISWYVVDFLSMEKSLVIEIDGGIHDDQQEYDAEREEVLHDLPHVLTTINEAPLSWKGEGRGRRGVGGEVD